MRLTTLRRAGGDGPDPGRSRRLEFALGLATLVLGASLVALVPELRHAVSLALHGDLAGLRQLIRGLGATGAVLLFGLIMLHAVLFYPAEIVNATAGFAYGFLPGLALVSAGWLASGLLSYFLGRGIARPLLERVFGAHRFARLESAVQRGGVPLLLAARLIPIVPFTLMCYVAGAAGVRLWRFVWTTAIGFLPLTAAVTYLGSRAQSLSLNDPFVWLAVGVMLVLLAMTRLVHLGPSVAGEE